MPLCNTSRNGSVVEDIRIESPGIFGKMKQSKSKDSVSNSSQIRANGIDGKVLAEDVFECLTRGDESYRLTLTQSELFLQPTRHAEVLERFSIQDLFGIQTYRHKKKNGSHFNGAYVCFYFYPRVRRGVLISSKCREKVQLVFKVQKPGLSFPENLEVAADWKKLCARLITGKFSQWQLDRLKSGELATTGSSNNKNGRANGRYAFVATEHNKPAAWPHGDLQDNEDTAHDLSVSISSMLLFLRRFVVILNPKSGQGKTMNIFKDTVYPILTEAGIKTMLMVTERPGHARSMVSSADLSEVDGIVTVGGDGLLYEVVNGLRSRADARAFADIPVGVIAGGSGNGLARSIAAYSGESEDYLRSPVLETTLAVAGGKVIPVNLLDVEVDSRKVYAFLSVGWGILADIDIESEVIRPIGESRFTLWSLLRLAKLKTYNAKLCYTRLPNRKEIQSNAGDLIENHSSLIPETVVEGDFVSVYATCQSHIGSDIIFAPEAAANDQLIHLTYIRGNVGRARITQFLLGLDSGSHLKVSGVEYVKVKEFSIRCDGGISGTVTLDGEKIAAEHISVRISPTPLSVFSL